MEIAIPKNIVTIALGAIFSWVGDIWVFVALTFAAIVLDYVSGLIAGRNNEGLNSKKAVKGLYKKMGILVLLCLGLFLDGAINHFMQEGVTFFEMPFNLPISHLVTIWIVITEAISICENLGRAGVPIPGVMMKFLRKAEKKIDFEEDFKNE